jgi:hypothetical protein
MDADEGRLALFAGDDYYPAGGGKDFRTLVSSVAEARRWLDGLGDERGDDHDWAHVLDLGTGEVVAEWHVLYDVEPKQWIEGDNGHVYEELPPPPDPPESSDGSKDRAWVEAWYAAKGRGDHSPPPADGYDECWVADGRPFFLTVKPHGLGGGPDWDVSAPAGGFDWLTREWDSYNYCPHWSHDKSGLATTADLAWTAARDAARVMAEHRAEILREIEHP